MSLYCFDTSALLDAWSRHYPPDVFPQVWRALGESIAESTVIATEEVRVEIGKKDDADPFVIALARVRDAIVVTGENDDGTSERPKIPTVCRHFGVRVVKPLDFLRAKRWVFGHRAT